MKNDDLVLGAICGFFLSTLIWFIINRTILENWETAAIRKGHAEYNQATGEWQWKEIQAEKKEATENVSN